MELRSEASNRGYKEIHEEPFTIEQVRYKPSDSHKDEEGSAPLHGWNRQFYKQGLDVSSIWVKRKNNRPNVMSRSKIEELTV